MGVAKIIISSVVDAAVSLLKDKLEGKDSKKKDKKDPILTTTTTTITRSTVNEKGARNTTTYTRTTSKQPLVKNHNNNDNTKLLSHKNKTNIKCDQNRVMLGQKNPINNDRLLMNNPSAQQLQQKSVPTKKDLKIKTSTTYNNDYRMRPKNTTPMTRSSSTSLTTPTRPISRFLVIKKEIQNRNNETLNTRSVLQKNNNNSTPGIIIPRRPTPTPNNSHGRKESKKKVNQQVVQNNNMKDVHYVDDDDVSFDDLEENNPHTTTFSRLRPLYAFAI
mmetsp:Transcript_12517/g.12278  ORF Transcript_12517/g.12278 Transcript_12517/m.12278 type:complete len:275 (+) Transcript_12517:68-892(+)